MCQRFGSFGCKDKHFLDLMQEKRNKKNEKSPMIFDFRWS
jgi:hypothetical protein